MADLSSLLSTTSGSSSMTQSELLVEAYKKTQESKITTLDTKKSELENKQVFFNKLRSQVDSMISQIDKFSADNASEKFFSKTSTLTDSSFFSITYDSDASLVNHSIKVNKLASNDNLITNRLALSDTDNFSSLAGDNSITLKINGKEVNINVNLNGDETNEQAMEKIAYAVNHTEDLGIYASLVKDTSTTGRLSFTSEETGETYNIGFADSNLFEKLGLNNAALNAGTESRTIATSTGAGYKKASISSLNSEIELDGITITRDSNSIDDALTGLTINLLKAQEATDDAVYVKSSVDTNAVKDFIQPLLDSFNEIIQFTSNNKTMLRSDTAVSSLKNKLREISTDSVSTVNSGDPSRLSEIGIKVNSDGTLSISDSDLLKETLESDPSKVSNLFTSEDGFANKLSSVVEGLTGETGIIQARTKALGQQIDSTKKRTEDVQARIDREAESLRKQYESMLQVMLEAQNQFSYLSTYTSI